LQLFPHKSSLFSVESYLIEVVTYTARRHNRLLDITTHVGMHKEVEKKQEQRTVIQYNEEFKVQPGMKRRSWLV